MTQNYNKRKSLEMAFVFIRKLGRVGIDTSLGGICDGIDISSCQKCIADSHKEGWLGGDEIFTKF